MLKKIVACFMALVLVFSGTYFMNVARAESNVTPVNLFDKEHEDNLLNTLAYNGTQEYNAEDYVNIFTTHYIPIKNLDVIYWGIVGSEAYIMEICDSEKNFIQQIQRANTDVAQLKTGDTVAGWKGIATDEVKYAYKINNESAAYVRITANISLKDELQVYTNLIDTTGWPSIQTEEVLNTSLEGKKILFVGDSITYASDDYGWAGRIADEFGAVTTKAGVSGASISEVRPDNRVITQLESNKANTYDYVILHGGVNDAWDSAPVGCVSDSFQVEDFDTTTFAGGLEELIYYAFEYFETAKIGYIINYARPTASVEVLQNMSAYFLEAKKVCEKWGISYLDLYFGTADKDGSRVAYSAELLQTSTDTNFISSGNIHLNAAGYDVISPYIGRWIQTIEHNEYHGTYGNPLAEQSALFLGDSITAADDDGRLGWAGRIAADNGMTCVNAGSSGATVSTHNEKNRIIDKFKTYKFNKYDFVIFHGGVNDAMRDVPIGSVSASRNIEDFDPSTFGGALEELFCYAYQYQSTAKFGYIVNYATPNSTWGGQTKDMSAYFDVAKKICEKWNVSYIDLYEGTVEVEGKTLSYSYDILKVDTPEYFLNSTSGQEGEVHISTKGYEVIAPYIADWMKSIESVAKTTQAYGDWAEITPQNGNFEVGCDGMEVYGWHKTVMQQNTHGKQTDEGIITAHNQNVTLKTEAEADGNKVAALKKTGAGIVAATSEKTEVTGGQEYRLSFDYRNKEISYANSSTTVANYYGIRLYVEELAEDGTTSTVSIQKNSTHYYADASYNENWSTGMVQFKTQSDTKYVVIYLWMGGNPNVYTTMYFDNVMLETNNDYKVFNGTFDDVTYQANAGRIAGVKGPLGWSMYDNGGNNYEVTTIEEAGRGNVACMKLNENTTGGTTTWLSSYIAVKGPQDACVMTDYKLIMEATQSTTIKPTFTIRIFCYDTFGGNPIKTAGKSVADVASSEWIKTVQNFTASELTHASKETKYIRIGMYVSLDATEAAALSRFELYVDDVSLEFGKGKLGFTKETTTANGVPRGDTQDYTSYWDIKEVNDGVGHESALKLSIKEGEQSFGGTTFYHNPISVVPGEMYQISFDYKLKGHLDIYATNKAYGAAFVVYYLDADGSRIDKNGTIATKPEVLLGTANVDTVDWVSSEVYQVIVPDNAVAIQYGMTIGTYPRGGQDLLEYYFDHIVIETTEDYEFYANEVKEHKSANDLLFVMLQGGDIVDGDGTVSVVDLVRMKKYAVNAETPTEITFEEADMNKNKQINDDDLELLRWKLLGIKKTGDLSNVK